MYCGPSITAVVLADHLYKWEGGENAGGGGLKQRTQWMHVNHVGESMSKYLWLQKSTQPSETVITKTRIL